MPMVMARMIVTVPIQLQTHHHSSTSGEIDGGDTDELISFYEQGGERVQDEYDAKLQLAPLTCTSFRSSQAESERSRTPQ